MGDARIDVFELPEHAQTHLHVGGAPHRRVGGVARRRVGAPAAVTAAAVFLTVVLRVVGKK